MTDEFSPAEPSELTIRALRTPADYLACVAIQREVWGEALTDITAPTILKIVQRIGGVSAGAFAPDGSMLGFVFGITGVERRRVVHWSHMLAVRAHVQNQGIGRRLKRFQRAAVAETGAHVIYWTFDPLVSRNAHLNINVMGVYAAEYTRDAYPSMDRGAGTDRLVVSWPMDDAVVRDRLEETARAATDPAFVEAPIVNPDPAAAIERRSEARLRVQIPGNFASLLAADVPAAAQWRANTRAAFEYLLGAGYAVSGFIGTPAHDRCYYLVVR
jgi:predicted GNAT superfamily acetyltransferase